MKVKVTLFVGGKLFDEVVIAANYEDAKATAIARNPAAKIVSVTAVFQVALQTDNTASKLVWPRRSILDVGGW